MAPIAALRVEAEHLPWGTTPAIEGQAWRSRSEGSQSSAKSLALSFTVRDEEAFAAVEPALLTETEMAHELEEPNNAAEIVDGEPTDNQAGISCSSSRVRNHGDFITFIQTTGSNTGSVRITYNYKADSTRKTSFNLGLGVSSNGINGSFSAGGEVTVRGSTSLDFPTVSVRPNDGRHYNFKTRTRYGVYKVECGVVMVCVIGLIPGVNCNVSSHYETRPEFITGATIVGTTNWKPKTPRRNCAEITRGGAVTRNSGQTVAYTTGVQGTIVGTSLSMKNTLSGGIEHSIRFENGSQNYIRYVCGQFAKIGDEHRPSGRLVGYGSLPAA